MNCESNTQESKSPRETETLRKGKETTKKREKYKNWTQKRREK